MYYCMQFFVSVGNKRYSRSFAKFEATGFTDALKKVTWKQVLACKKEYETDYDRADSVEVKSPTGIKLFSLDAAKKIIG